MKGPPLGPGGKDITWPDQVAPWSRKASSTRNLKPQTSNPTDAVSSFYKGKFWHCRVAPFCRYHYLRI